MKIEILVILNVLAATSFAKIFTPNELASQLKANGIPDWQVPTWQCIVKWESAYNTGAHNTNTGDHGIFQISQIYWCSPPGKGCQMSCNSLRDDDISNDIRCVKIIYDEFKKREGNGFKAWVAYDKHCR